MNIWPQFTDKMISRVTEILKSGKVNQWTNPVVKEFEDKFSVYFGCNHSIAEKVQRRTLN